MKRKMFEWMALTLTVVLLGSFAVDWIGVQLEAIAERTHQQFQELH